jgi:hypothetical protein
MWAAVPPPPWGPKPDEITTVALLQQWLLRSFAFVTNVSTNPSVASTKTIIITMSQSTWNRLRDWASSNPDVYSRFRLSDPDSVRILRLQPGSREDNIKITLDVTSLNKPVPYEALSYAWDSHHGNTIVSCHGTDIPVTNNCAAALRELRYEDRQRTLWIDAVCINQSSTDERNHQVAMMGKVYQNAQCVIVWLGEAKNRSDEAMMALETAALSSKSELPQLMEKFREDFYGYSPSILLLGDRICLLITLADPTTGSGSSHAASKPALHGLLNRPWMLRIWTVQEVAFAKNCIVRCGSAELSWRNFWQGSRVLSLSKGFVGLRHNIRQHDEAVELVRGIGTARHSLDYLVQKIPEFMSFGRYKRATDERDRIFAVYYLLKHLGVPLPAPDYTISLQECFTQASIALTTYANPSYVLPFCPPSQISDLPSWVTDWRTWVHRPSVPHSSTNPTNSTGSLYEFRDRKELCLKGEVPLVIAAAGMRWRQDQSSTRTCYLNVSWLRSWNSQVLRDYVLNQMELVRMFRSWALVATGGSGNTSLSHDDNVDAFLNIDASRVSQQVDVYADLLCGDYLNLFRHLEHGREYVRAWALELLGEQTDLTNWGSQEKSFSAEHEAQKLMTQYIKDHLDSPEIIESAEFQSWCRVVEQPPLVTVFDRLRSFRSEGIVFRTSDGKIGIGPSNLQAGDEAVLFSGFAHVMVLRRDGDFHRVLGPAYMEGSVNDRLLKKPPYDQARDLTQYVII